MNKITALLFLLISLNANAILTPTTSGGGGGINQLTSDVTAGPGTGSQVATVVSVGGSSAANVNAAELLANGATDANTASKIVKRDASGGFKAGIVQLLSDSFQFGTSDAFLRTQIWNKASNAVLRLGSWGQDGDATNASSEGIIVYSSSLTGLPVSATDGGYARVKHNRFGLFTVDSTLPAYLGGDYYFRTDDVGMYFKNNSGTKTFEVTRANGQIDTALAAGVVHADASGILNSEAQLATSRGGTNHGNYTAGSVSFAGAGGTSLTEDNANMFWNDTTNRLGVGTNAPTATLDIFAEEGTTGVPHLTLSGDVYEAGTISRDSTGDGGWLALWGGSTAAGGGSIYLNGDNVADGGSVQMTLGKPGSNYDWFDDTVSVLLMRMQDNGNLGVGTSYAGSVNHKLQVEGDIYAKGGLIVDTNATQPTCAVGIRGMIWNLQGGTGVADILQVCQKNASDLYVWTNL